MLELLRAAARYGQRTDSRAMPDDIIAFELEYSTAPNLETERARLEDLLQGDGFDLFVFSEEDEPELLILQFAGVPRQQSAELLLKEAAGLNEALDTFSVVPAVDAPYTEILSTPRTTEGIGEVIWSLCQSSAAGSSNPQWARNMMRIPDAEASHGVNGSGVLIGQPDTGVADHDELGQGLDTAKGYDFLAGRPGPIDPLSKSMGSPGHGTGTSSVVISRQSGQVTGTALGATLVPMRVMNKVVIGLSGRAIAAGIDHARRQGCRVITMSLGGVWSRSIRAAIKRAVDADLIVLAAAGNCVGSVTFPASQPNVIAVAGVDHNQRKWRGSSAGPPVDVSAPGENVYVARRAPVDPGHVPTPAELADVNARGQGTSFAVALTAGVATLWIEKFGLTAIRQAASQRGISVNELFRLALRSTAQVPSGWDSANMGAGIVDAKALLDTDLSAIPGVPVPTESASPALIAFGRDFEGSRFQAEANFLAVDWQIRSNPDFSGRLETALPTAPSPEFAKELERQQPVSFPTPAALVAPATPPVPIDQALRRLALRGDRMLESAADTSAESALETLRTEGTSSLMDTVETAFDKRAQTAGDLVNTDLQKEAMQRIDTLLTELASDTNTPRTAPEEQRATLEALVRLTGRPAIRVRRDGSEIQDPRLESWAGVLVGTRHKWWPLTAAVGRIDVLMPDGRWVHAGTGFVMADGQIMTNRHVIDTFVDGLPSAPGDQNFLELRKASIIFDPEAEDETTRYELTGIVTAGKSRIGKFVDLGKLDMAVVAMNPDNGHGAPPPPIDTRIVSMTDTTLTDILLSGYPAEPTGAAGPASDSEDFLAFWDRLEELYGEEYGKQFLSPGKIMERPGAVSGDDNNWTFTHDATTLAGNSGSAIISLHGAMQFCGLHFGGSTLSQNFAHDIHSVLEEADGVFDAGVLD